MPVLRLEKVLSGQIVELERSGRLKPPETVICGIVPAGGG